MFDWLKKPDHPMATPEAAAQHLAELPANDPAKALDDIGAWITSLQEAQGFKPELRAAVLGVVDETGQQHHDRLLVEYLAAPQIYETKSQIRLQKLLGFWSRVLDAYIASALELEEAAGKAGPGRDAFDLAVCRGLRAGSQVAKTRHLGYQAVEKSLWERLYRLYLLAERHQRGGAELHAYRSEPLPTRIEQELLRALMMEFAAPEKLAPEHVELAFRITARVGNSLAAGDAPGPGLRFWVDFAHPAAAADGARGAPPGGSGARWFGPGTALARLDEMIKHNDAHALPTERRFGRDFSVWDKMTVLRHLLLYWGEGRPARRDDRSPGEGELLVLHGFGATRKVVPQTDTSEMGAIADTLKEKAGLALAAEAVDQAPESWAFRDVSASGIGADVAPAPNLWVKVGKVCALKTPSSKTWWVGVVRRLDASNRAALRVGIELLSRRPHALWLKFVGEGQTAAANWETSSGSYGYDYVNVVLLVPEKVRSLNDATLLMSPENFIGGVLCEALMGEKSRLVRLGQPVATGDDFVIAACEWQ
jgi:hypothetical protein